MANTRFPIVYSTQGDYRADVTRDTFAPGEAFRRVIAQQGRPVLDADLNEQAAVLLHYLECLTKDLGGSFFGPTGANAGFKVAVTKDDQTKPTLSFGPGRYYVGGVLVENAADFTLTPALESDKSYLVYLDVWEKHVTALQRTPLREVALGRTDTATRAQVTWQIRMLANPAPDKLVDANALAQALSAAGARKPGVALLRARAKTPAGSQDSACVTAPDAQYRGLENQLYRVEIHGSTTDGPLIKFSRENSSVQFAVQKVSGDTLTLAQWSQDARFGLSADNWVELVDDERPEPTPLVRIAHVDRESLTVTLASSPAVDNQRVTDGHVYLRRWDQAGDVIQMKYAATYPDAWIPLERGIEVQISLPAGVAVPAAGAPSPCQPGDYWLIPARVASKNVEWPSDDADPKLAAAVPPRGVKHDYAPLAMLSFANGKWQPKGLRTLLAALSSTVG